MKRILVTGSMAYDLLLGYEGSFVDGVDVDALDSLSMAFVTPQMQRHHGGTGVNIAWNLKLLGGDPLLVSTVGSDGGPYKALLEERGIDASMIEQKKNVMTATAIIATDTGERQITFYAPGADAKGTWPSLDDQRDDLGYAIVAPRDASLMQKGLAWCHTFGVPVLFDPGQQIMSFGVDDLRRAIGQSSGVIANGYEWALLSERLDMTENDLLQLTPLLVVTRGEEGLTLYTESGPQTIAACKPDKVINPTGAGDALRAGLLTGLAAGWSLIDAARLGASVASFVVEIQGTQLDSLDRDEVWQRARQIYGEDLPRL